MVNLLTNRKKASFFWAGDVTSVLFQAPNGNFLGGSTLADPLVPLAFGKQSNVGTGYLHEHRGLPSGKRLHNYGKSHF